MLVGETGKAIYFYTGEQSDSIYNQVSQLNIKGWVHNIKAGADYFITNKSTVGFVTTINLNNSTNTTQRVIHL